jgi:hypothetical protein
MAVSAKGMRRSMFADGALHLLSDGKCVLVQVRTPHLTSAEDAAGFAGKLAVQLDRKEAFKVVRTLVEYLGAMDG